jgi:hypothetical protein
MLLEELAAIVDGLGESATNDLFRAMNGVLQSVGISHINHEQRSRQPE